MLKKSTIQLLRFPFAFFLMPVYLFALSQTVSTNWGNAILIFIILHGLLYPSSNGYNSYMDRDVTAIGGVRNPMLPTTQLLQIVFIMDCLALVGGLFVSKWFAVGILVYILASRLYSSRTIRLKKYPISGFLLVVICQGGLVYWMVYHGVHTNKPLLVPLSGIIASTFLIAGAYPLTQIYQHAADSRDGVTTISMLLGIRGTFRLSAVFFCMAFLALGIHFALQLELIRFFVLLLCFLPISVYFIAWARKVWKNESNANFDNLMFMNKLSSLCSNSGFLILLIWKVFD